MNKLKSLLVSGKILVLGDSCLVIGYCTPWACLSKLELFHATNKTVAICQWLDGAAMFHHVGCKDNYLIDW